MGISNRAPLASDSRYVHTSTEHDHMHNEAAWEGRRGLWGPDQGLQPPPRHVRQDLHGARLHLDLRDRVHGPARGAPPADLPRQALPRPGQPLPGKR